MSSRWFRRSWWGSGLVVVLADPADHVVLGDLGPGCHRDWWGRGGRNFWPGFVGGLVAGAACSGGYYYGGYGRPYVVATPTVVAAPTVVTTPVVTTPVVTTPVYTQTVYPTTTTVINNSTTYVQPTYTTTSTPLVGAGVNVLGLKVGVGVGY